MRIILYIIFLSGPVVLRGQDAYQIDYRPPGVESMEIKSYLVEEKNGEFIKIRPEWQLPWIHDTRLSYNELGQLIEKSSYRLDGTLVVKNQNYYDSLGTLIKRVEYENGEKIVREDSVIYDLSNQPFQIYRRTTSDRFEKNDSNFFLAEIYAYDSIGNCTELVLFYDDNSVYGKLVFVYDSLSNCVRRERYEAKGRRKFSLFSLRTYKFNDSKQVISEEFYYPPERLSMSYFYYYSPEGLLIEKIINDEDKGQSRHRFVYEYDERGNWIVQTHYIDDRAAYMIERTLSYFP